MSTLKAIINQFKRPFTDNGSGDVDFTDQEQKLSLAIKHLNNATDELKRAAELLNVLSRRIIG